MLALELARRAEPHEGGSLADRAWPFGGWRLVAWLAVFATTSFKDIDLVGSKNSRLLLHEKLWAESTALFDKVHGLARPSSNSSVASVASAPSDVFVMGTCHPPPIIMSLALGDEQSAGSSSSSRCERATVASASGFMIPYDFMHVELEGSLKNELAAMLYYFLRRRPSWKFTLKALNDRIREYAWPAGFRSFH